MYPCGGVYCTMLHKHFGEENEDLKYVKADHPLRFAFMAS